MLKSTGVTTVAMESRGVYWVPVYEVLESAGIEVVVANARDCALMRDVRCKASAETSKARCKATTSPDMCLPSASAQASRLLPNQVKQCDARIEPAPTRLKADKEAPTKPLPTPPHKTKASNAVAFDVRPSLYQIAGTDLTQIHGIGPYLALRLVSECGTDVSRWSTVKHFTSWLSLSPGCKISGAKVLSSRTARPPTRLPRICVWLP